jgi:hypothetical protein
MYYSRVTITFAGAVQQLLASRLPLSVMCTPAGFLAAAAAPPTAMAGISEIQDASQVVRMMSATDEVKEYLSDPKTVCTGFLPTNQVCDTAGSLCKMEHLTSCCAASILVPVAPHVAWLICPPADVCARQLLSTLQHACGLLVATLVPSTSPSKSPMATACKPATQTCPSVFCTPEHQCASATSPCLHTRSHPLALCVAHRRW